MAAAKKADALSPKEQRIKSEKAKLTEIFKDLSPDVHKAPDKLIDNIAFMAISLEDLQAYINANGYTEEYQNGKDQWGKKKSSEVDVYNVMIKNYKAAFDGLMGMLPKAPPGGDDDGFDEFADSRED